MDEPIETFYITKHALTQGIEKEQGRVCEAGGGSMIECHPVGYSAYYHGEGREWHRTREAAIKKAEEMRLAKIKSIKKSLAKMEALRFE